MPYTNPSALGGRNVSALLDTIAFSEGTSIVVGSDDGYNVLVGGALFRGYDEHPRAAVKTRWGWSDAAGRYQIMAAIPGRIRTDTWDWASRAAGAKDFGPPAQDLVAVFLIKRRGAFGDIVAGRLRQALAKCRAEWASLPGAGYGQHENTYEQLRAQYLLCGGEITGE